MYSNLQDGEIFFSSSRYLLKFFQYSAGYLRDLFKACVGCPCEVRSLVVQDG